MCNDLDPIGTYRTKQIIDEYGESIFQMLMIVILFL